MRKTPRFTKTIGKRPPQAPFDRGSDGIDRFTFDSVGEAVVDALADYAQNEGNRQFMADCTARHLTGRDSWANYYTRESLLAALVNPPAELLSAVDEMRKAMVSDICPPVTSRRRVLRNQDSGSELDPAAVLVRSLTPWERMSREQQPRRTVTIGVDLSAYWSQAPGELLWRGAAATALADILTQRGVNVEIVAFFTMRQLSDENEQVVAKYIVKSPDMPLDVGAVAVALSEIAFARVVALCGMARHVTGHVSEALGFVTELPAVDVAGLDYVVGRHTTTRPLAEEWIRAAAARQESEACHV